MTSIGYGATVTGGVDIEFYCSSPTPPAAEFLWPRRYGRARLFLPSELKSIYQADAVWGILKIFEMGLSEDGTQYWEKGLAYSLDYQTQTASVTASSYARDYVIVPEKIEVNGNSYAVTSIGWSAFGECSSLISISIPSSVTSISEYAFDRCYALTSISIPSSVTTIGYGVFRSCSSLTSISIPSSVTSIGWSAFAGCSALTNISIPSSVTSIGAGLFSGCSALTSIKVDASNKIYDSRVDCNAIIETATNILTSGCRNTIIPSSVTSIGNSAFSGFSDLTSVCIPSSVTSIGEFAFSSCSALTSVSIPSSVTSIGNSAFSRCSALMSVYCFAVVPPTLTEDIANYSQTLYVPYGTKQAYQADSWWGKFKNIVEFDAADVKILQMDETLITIYNINGTIVGRADSRHGMPEGLKPGLYVVKSKGKSRKIIVN